MAARLSERGQVPPFRAMDILKDVERLHSSGRETFLLCLGQPATPAPTPVLEAAELALRHDSLGYTASNGTIQLREHIAQHYLDEYSARVDPADIVITTGSSAAFTAIFLAAFEAGDTVAMTRPGYPAYRNTLRSLGCRVHELDCGPQTRWQPSVQQLDELASTQGAPAGLIIASPANPTGTVLGAQELAAICEWCDERGTLLISDEIYHGIVYGPRCPSATRFAHHGRSQQSNVTVGSFSKYHSMTGWRLGWAVLPRELVRPVELLLGNLNLSAPTLSQLAAPAAFSAAADIELTEHVRRYAVNRQIVVDRLAELGISGEQLAPADGAFYCWADVSGFTADSALWCAELLDATGVAVTPGIDFAENVLVGADGSPVEGEYRDPALDGSRYVRISFAGSTEEVSEGMRRLVAFAR